MAYIETESVQAMMMDYKALHRELVSRFTAEPKFGQTLAWCDKDGWHSKRWGHRARLQYRKKVKGECAAQKRSRV